MRTATRRTATPSTSKSMASARRYRSSRAGSASSTSRSTSRKERLHEDRRPQSGGSAWLQGTALDGSRGADERQDEERNRVLAIHAARPDEPAHWNARGVPPPHGRGW